MFPKVPPHFQFSKKFVCPQGVGFLRRAPLALLALLWSLGISPLRAELLVKEPFDYPADGSLDGQDGGVGFGDSWQHKYGTTSDAKIVAGLTFSDYPVSGKAASFHATSEDKSVCAVRSLSANLGDSPQTVWMSYLFRYTVTPGDKPVFYSGMNTCNNRYPDDYRFGIAGLAGSGKFGITYQSPKSASTSKGNAPDTTYLLIGKYVGGSGATIWVLTETNYEAIKAGGITEEKLNATNSGKATVAFVEEQADILQEFLSIGASTFGDGSTLDTTFDELKLGSTLGDVTGQPAATP